MFVKVVHYLVILLVILPVFLTNNKTWLYVGLFLSSITLLSWLIFDKCLLTQLETRQSNVKYEGFIFRHVKSLLPVSEHYFNLMLRGLLAILISAYLIKLGYW